MKIKSIHPLASLFMLASFAYGLGFILLSYSDIIGTSSLYVTMAGIDPRVTIIWGVALIVAVVVTLAGYRIASLLGFAAWTFALICYALNGEWMVLVAVTLPNMLFWLWQHTH